MPDLRLKGTGIIYLPQFKELALAPTLWIVRVTNCFRNLNRVLSNDLCELQCSGSFRRSVQHENFLERSWPPRNECLIGLGDLRDARNSSAWPNLEPSQRAYIDRRLLGCQRTGNGIFEAPIAKSIVRLTLIISATLAILQILLVRLRCHILASIRYDITRFPPRVD